MQRLSKRPDQRRITRFALVQQAVEFLTGALPSDWICQPLSPTLSPAAAGPGRRNRSPGSHDGAADILIISPRGRCHFLLVRAPADRWWDGGPRSVPAETITEPETHLMRRLRAAGHKARPIRCAQDLARALKAWGCPIEGAVWFGGARRPASPVPATAAVAPRRATLRLSSQGGQADA